MKFYIAVIGKTCAGKETTFRLFRGLYPALAVSIHHFSDPLSEILNLLGLEKSRPNQQNLSTDLRRRFGEDLLGNVLYRRALADPASVVFLDGVRRPKDVEMLRLLSIERSFLLYIDAPIEKRFERLKRRADRPGDAQKTWKEFLAEQSAEAESLIETLKPLADWHLDNSADEPEEFRHLKEQIFNFSDEKIFSRMKRGGTNVA